MSSHALPGALVMVRDEQWRITRVDTFDRCNVVTLDGAGRRRLRVIEPFDHVNLIGSGGILRRHRRAVFGTALKAIATERPPAGLWTAASAAIDLLPYQLEPALAVLRGSTRVLIADAVGLGKTIQAGLILSELRERGWVDRALVVCPAGLRDTWSDELRGRFGIACAVVDQTAIGETRALLPPGINPWATHATAIASVDYIKRPEVLAAICELPIDLVIADEAHHLTPGTDRGEAVSRIAARSPWCVLLSATPHSGDESAFEYLTRLGAHHDALTIFRRSRRDARPAAGRRERIICIRPSSGELQLLQGVDQYAQAIWRGKGAGDPSAQLVAITIAKRAASSTLALERTLRRRLMLLNTAPEPVQPALPWDEEDEADDCGARSILATAGLENEAEERAAIDRLLQLVEQCSQPAKLTWLARSIARFKEPVIVFTSYRDTLEAVLAALPRHLRAVSICGATPINERRCVVDAFNQGRADVLVATDTAGEGLNLHHRCRLVIDVELPWNPLRLEQRIGRVDRFGQRHRVHALHLMYADTIEERVLDRVLLRRRRAQWTEDPDPIDERAVAAAVIANEIAPPQWKRRVAGSTVEGVAAEHARLVRQRSISAEPLAAHQVIAAAPKRRATSTMVALHRVTFLNDVGIVVAEEACAHAVQVRRRAVDQRRYVVVKEVIASNRLRSFIRRHVEERCVSIHRELAPFSEAVSNRIAAIRSQITRERAREVQRSLFDRRADTEADQFTHIANALDAALARRALSITSPVNPESASAQLTATWPSPEQ